jgi:hypothetical protein
MVESHKEFFTRSKVSQKKLEEFEKTDGVDHIIFRVCDQNLDGTFKVDAVVCLHAINCPECHLTARCNLPHKKVPPRV